MKRDKEKTKKKLIDAVGEIISQQGFSSLGVNAVATRAGVDKVLIYRYFGGLEKLVEAYADMQDYWIKSNFMEHLDFQNLNAKQLEDAMKEMFTGQFRELIENKQMQEMLRWELMEKTTTTDKLAEKREEMGMKILKAYEEKTGDTELDMGVITAIMISGIYYLVLRSKTADVFNGILLNTKDGQKRIENGIEQLISILSKELIHSKK